MYPIPCANPTCSTAAAGNPKYVKPCMQFPVSWNPRFKCIYKHTMYSRCLKCKESYPKNIPINFVAAMLNMRAL